MRGWGAVSEPRRLAGLWALPTMAAATALQWFVLSHVITLAKPKCCCLCCWGWAATGQGVPRTVPHTLALGLLPIIATPQPGAMDSAHPDTGN